VSRRRRLAVFSALALAVLVLATFVWRDESRALAAHAMTLGRWPSFIALVVLPLLGFPLSVLALAAGLRFGFGPALLLLAPALALHLVFVYAAARRWFKLPLLRWLARYDFALPQAPAGESLSVALLVNLVPGPPYAVKTYLLALTELPFRAYFVGGFCANLLGVSMAILTGDFLRDMTPLRGTLLAIYVLLVSVLCHRLIRRLRRRVAPPASAARD